MNGDTAYFYGFVASVIAAAMSAFGIFAMASFGDWAKRNSAYSSSFAVGLLTVGVLFHLIPEAASESQLALLWLAVGFAGMVLIGITVQSIFHSGPEGAALTFGYASIIALASHSFLDGAIYAASFQDEIFTGWIATSGLLFHEFPEGVIAYALLAQAGLRRGRAILLAMIASALTTIAGTIISLILLDVSGEIPIPAMLGIAAGALIYVLIVHLGPDAAKTPGRRGYDLAMLGVLSGTIAIVLQQLGGGHH
ncbi:ZIP family metal transporter [Hyphococcus sp. DH-69]|uniref:ZIP family metal transporter n=1 Tax=Hyphococcus formosus TaxID=3143534 RepID=UPI00398ABC1E